MSSATIDDMPLSDHARDVLTIRHARRETPSTRRLNELLAENEYESNPMIVAFDEAFGGLSFPDGEADEDWDMEEDGGWLVGTELCLELGGHDAPRGGDSQEDLGLIPIVYSPNDIIYFMDPQGQCWGQDTIEEPEALPCAKDGATLVTRLILETLLWSEEAKRTEKAGLHGDKMAAEAKYKLVPEASDEFSRWWAGPAGFIAEYQTSGNIEARTLHVMSEEA